MLKIAIRRISLLSGTFGLTEDQLTFQALALDFAEKELAPHACNWDKNGHFPIDKLRKAGELGFGGIYTRDEYGGTGLGKLEATLILEALSRGCMSTASYISIHNMCCGLLDSFGSEPQRKRWQEGICKFELLTSYCLTEAGSGSDAGAMLTNAKHEGSSYIINGSKSFISGGEASDLYFVMLKTQPRQVSCFIVEKGTPGLTFGKKEDKLGWRTQPTQVVNFDNVVVSKENLLGDIGEGMKIAMKGLEGGRLTIAACALGGAWLALEKASIYMSERSQFGTKLKDFQHLRFRMADCLAKLTEVRMLTRNVAGLVDAGISEKNMFTAIAKMRSTDICYEIADECLQMFGGYGLLRDYGMERLLRELRVLKIIEGTNEIMKHTLAKNLFSHNH